MILLAIRAECKVAANCIESPHIDCGKLGVKPCDTDNIRGLCNLRHRAISDDTHVPFSEHLSGNIPR